MIAVDISHLLNSYPHMRGPAVFLNNFCHGSLGREVHFVFNPHYVGSQLYFQVLAREEFPRFMDEAFAVPPEPYRPLWVRIARRIRAKVEKIIPASTIFFRLAQKFVLARGYVAQRIEPPKLNARVAHHSSFTQIISFLASDSIWGLPMPATKKTLFLYDTTFFEILRGIASPVTSTPSPFIVQHIATVNRAICESHSMMVPTAYLANQVKLHFPAAHDLPIAVVPLASTLVSTEQLDAADAGITAARPSKAMRFTPLRKTARDAVVPTTRDSILVVCGFDGFKNDNKGMGHILDVIRLHKALFPETPVTFTLVAPPREDLLTRIDELDIADRVTVRHGLPIHQLIEHYKRAKCLWAHSIDEGFCLPILEASLLKTPVLVPDVPSLREIWGDTVQFINVFNRYDAVNTLQHYCQNLDAGIITSAKTYARARTLTMQKTVDGVWSAMQKVA